MDALAAGSSAKRPKTSAEKRKNRSSGSKWRRGTGAAKVARSQAWRETSVHSSWGFWIKVFKSRNPYAVVTGQAVRKFIIDLMQKFLISPGGPPTAEYWTPVYRQEDNVTVRHLNKVILQVAPMLEEDWDLPYADWDLPYVSSRECTWREWIKLYGDGEPFGHYDAFSPWWMHFDSLHQCPWLQRRDGSLQGVSGLGFG